MFSQIRRMRYIAGCTVAQVLTSDGVSGYVAVRGIRTDKQFRVLAMRHVKNPDVVRVKARQL
jgi:hypothetical protein